VTAFYGNKLSKLQAVKCGTFSWRSGQSFMSSDTWLKSQLLFIKLTQW